ncbi:MAG: hypothetical protein K1W02_02805 [Muribaculaceae bacterium]
MNANKDKEGKGGGNAATGGRRIDFLGYCFTHDRVMLRKSIKQRFARKVRQCKPGKRRREILASYWGWCKWGNCKNLWNTITDNDMSFKDIGITGRNEMKDGQRFFDVRKVKVMEILNMPITVLDFIPDVKTRHGDGRYAVKIMYDGQEMKFITGSYTLKSQLDQAKEANALPIETRLRKRDLGEGTTDYIFD